MPDLSGVVVVNKPSGPTSFDVVRRVKGLFKVKRVGHTGTLDPTATGVLPICVGEATKVAGFIADGEKEYEATVRFGQVTDTQDAAGKVLETRPVEGLTRRSLLLAPPLDLPVDEHRPGELERLCNAPMLLQSPLQGGPRLLQLAASRRDQASAATGGRERPRPVTRAPLLLQPVHERFRFVRAPERHQRLHGVGNTRDDRRLRRSHPLEIVDRRFEVLMRLSRPSE